jgi:hypothetical protein
VTQSRLQRIGRGDWRLDCRSAISLALRRLHDWTQKLGAWIPRRYNRPIRAYVYDGLEVSMRRFVTLLVAAAIILVPASSGFARAGNLSVTVTYTGKGKVDDTRENLGCALHQP